MISERELISVAPFRARFLVMEPALRDGERGGLPRDAATRIAGELGWRHPQGWLDGARVRRTLGLQPAPQGHGRPLKIQDRVTYETAVLLCGAMDIDPVDMDL